LSIEKHGKKPKFFSNNAKLFKDQKIASKDLELEPDQYNDALSLEEIPERELNYTKAFAGRI
jgi:hypothetical protein